MTDGFGDTDTLISIEAVRGSNFADTLTGGNTDNDDFERFKGLAGNDTIDGGTGFDEIETIADHGLAGAAGKDVVAGAALEQFKTETVGARAAADEHVIKGRAAHRLDADQLSFRSGGCHR